MEASAHYDQERRRLAADRLREREARLAKLEVDELAGDPVTDEQKAEVRSQIDALRQAAESSG